MGIKAQSFWKTFNISNLGSNYPYFNRAYVVSSRFGCPLLCHENIIFSLEENHSILEILEGLLNLAWAEFLPLRAFLGFFQNIYPWFKLSNTKRAIVILHKLKLAEADLEKSLSADTIKEPLKKKLKLSNSKRDVVTRSKKRNPGNEKV